MEKTGDHKKKQERYFLTQEKWNEMNSKNVLVKVLEDEKEEGGGARVKCKWVRRVR